MVDDGEPSSGDAPRTKDAKHDSDSNEVSSEEDTKGTSKSKAFAAGKGKKRPLAGSEDDKKAERRAANRRSAFQSRQRRKILIEDLQKTVASLSKENSDLRKGNEDLRIQLKAVLLENHQYRMQQQQQQQQIPGSQAAAAGLMQASTLFAGGQQQAALSQLLGNQAGAGSSGAPAAPGPGTTSVGGGGENDSLLNTRLAMVAAQARANDLRQKQDSTSGPTPAHGATATPTNDNAAASTGEQGSGENQSIPASGAPPQGAISAGMQSLLESAGLQAPLPAGGPLSALNGFLDSKALGGAGMPGVMPQLGGLSALMESMSRPQGAQPPTGLNDIQLALLSGSGAGNLPSLSGLGVAGPGTKPALNENTTVSNALRNLLQKNQQSQQPPAPSS